MLHLILPLISTLFAIIYLYFINREISGPRTLFKTLPIAVLALATIGLGQPLLGAALALSAVGDFFLSRKKEDWFIAGLVAFLVGHVFYIILFAQLMDLSAPNWKVIGALVLYALVFGGVLIKKDDKYRLPIIAYICILSTMGILAVHLPDKQLYATIGAMVFIVSDSLLALRMFVVKNDTTKKQLSLGVWFTYVIAQFLIFYGFRLTV